METEPDTENFDRNLLCDGQTIKQGVCVSTVISAQDAGGTDRATKNAVVKYLASRRAHLISMRYVNRQGCFCA